MCFQFLEVVSGDWQPNVCCQSHFEGVLGNAFTSNAFSPRAYKMNRASALDSRHFLCLGTVFYLRRVLKDFALCSGFRRDWSYVLLPAFKPTVVFQMEAELREGKINNSDNRLNFSKMWCCVPYWACASKVSTSAEFVYCLIAFGQCMLLPQQLMFPKALSLMGNGSVSGHLFPMLYSLWTVA